MDDARRKVLQGLMVAGGGALTASLTQTEAAAQAAQAPGSGALKPQAVRRILDAAVETANATNSPFRSITGTPRTTKMHIAVVDRSGKLLDVRSMGDAWEGSLDIAIAKARTAAFFSSNENALTSRIIGLASQAHNGLPGGDPSQAGPLWGIWASNQVGISGNQQTRNGLITFPGGVPLYKNGVLVGGIGVSGDGVDQDEAVAFGGAVGYEPGATVAQLGFD